jgi:hypothetical protein
MKVKGLLICTIAGIILLLVFSGGCLSGSDTHGSDSTGTVDPSGTINPNPDITPDQSTGISPGDSPYGGTGGNYEMSKASSGSCSSGYARYTTSAGHCCPTGYPYYYDGECHSCSLGYARYTTSAGQCCPTGYPYYYDGACHSCSQGYTRYTTSAGQCCPTGYPYYSSGKCNTQSPESSASYGTSAMVVDSNSGCPATKDLQCSGWIVADKCQLQSCTCYDSGLQGDTTAAYYHTSDGADFRCSGAGETLSCTAAAAAAAQHCT